MDIVWHELTYGWHDQQLLIRIVVRLTVAMVLGAIVGVQREFSGKPVSGPGCGDSRRRKSSDYREP